MELVFYSTNGGSCEEKDCWQLDGTNCTESQCLKSPMLLLAGTDLADRGAARCSITSHGKLIVFFQLPEDAMLVYVSARPYPPRAISALLRSFATMIVSFDSSYIRPIHLCGLHLHNMFGAARVHPQPLHSSIHQLMNQLSAAAASSLCALYTQNMIILATDQYWQMPKRDLHALDLLVRHSEAPFTMQRFQRYDGSLERAFVFCVFKTMKFVCVHGDAFDPLHAASQLLPEVFRRHEERLKPLESAPPIANRQDGVIAWIVHDLVTHRFFGECPQDEELRMIEMIAKCYEIVDEDWTASFATGEAGKITESIHVNRVQDVSFKLQDHMFFYIPQVVVLHTHYFRDPHLWSMFILHDLKRNINEMRDFAKHTMLNMIQYVKPVNPVAPYLKSIVNKFKG
jgi:hypothetical protein